MCVLLRVIPPGLDRSFLVLPQTASAAHFQSWDNHSVDFPTPSRWKLRSGCYRCFLAIPARLVHSLALSSFCTSSSLLFPLRSQKVHTKLSSPLGAITSHLAQFLDHCRFSLVSQILFSQSMQLSSLLSSVGATFIFSHSNTMWVCSTVGFF